MCVCASSHVSQGFSVENHLEPLLAVLEPVKRDWYDLGMHLSLSENFLDETETIIDTVEECLKEMIQNWLRYHEPTLESLNRALTEIKHSPVTFDTFQQGKLMVLVDMIVSMSTCTPANIVWCCESLAFGLCMPP